MAMQTIMFVMWHSFDTSLSLFNLSSHESCSGCLKFHHPRFVTFNKENLVQHTTSSHNNKKQLFIGSSFVLIAALGFSAKAILIKLAYGYSQPIDAITLMALRLLFSLPFFLIIAFWQGKVKQDFTLTIKDWLRIIILGILGYYLASLLDFSGLKYISAGLERIILFLYPTFVILFSAVFLKRPITLREMMALVLSYAGMLWVFIDHFNDNSSNVLIGSILVLSSAISFAFFIMGSGIMIKRIGSARFTAYSMTVACFATVFHYFLNHNAIPLTLPTRIYSLAFVMAIFSTVLPAFMMNAGIRHIGSGSASIISSAGPIGTLFLAYLILNEPFTIAQFIGTALVLIGVFIASQAKS